MFVAASVNIINGSIKIKIKTTKTINLEMYEFIYSYNIMFFYLSTYMAIFISGVPNPKAGTHLWASKFIHIIGGPAQLKKLGTTDIEQCIRGRLGLVG